MTWNYRLVRYHSRQNGELWYGIHEVYYDKDGQACFMTVNPVSFQGVTDKEVLWALEKALDSAKNKPIFDEPEPGAWPGKAPRMKS